MLFTPRSGSFVKATARRGPSGAFHGSCGSSRVASWSAEKAASRRRRIASDAARGRESARHAEATPRARVASWSPSARAKRSRASGSSPSVTHAERSARRRLRFRVEQHLEQLRAGHAVDHAVMDLLEQRRAPVGEALDDVHLPERALAVERRGEQARHRLAQLALAARRRQAPARDVVLDAEAGVVLPARVPERERHAASRAGRSAAGAAGAPRSARSAPRAAACRRGSPRSRCGAACASARDRGSPRRGRSSGAELWGCGRSRALPRSSRVPRRCGERSARVGRFRSSHAGSPARVSSRSAH